MQKLTYCGLGVEDVEPWTRFAVEALGLASEDDGDVRRLRMDDLSWRFALHKDAADDILYAGFALDDGEQLKALRGRLDEARIGWTAMSGEECAERRVAEGFWLRDPDGLRLEFVRDHARAATPFIPRSTEGFLTGAQGLGHVVLSVTDLEKSIRFYEALGLAVSDFITFSPTPDLTLRIAFLHCNERHHSVAIAALPGGKRLNHIMMELLEVDDVLRGYQRCVNMGYRTGGIGRHPNDRMLSFYVTSPAGFDIEYGWGGRAVGEDWSIAEYDKVSLWGHEPAAS